MIPGNDRRVYARSPLTHALILVKFEAAKEPLNYEALGAAMADAAQGVFDHQAYRLIKAENDETAASQGVIVRSTDEKTFIQANNESCAAMRLAPYERWEVFFPCFKALWECYRSRVNVPALKHVGMRYVNQIELPDEGTKLPEVLNSYPTVASIPGMERESAMSVVDFSDANVELHLSTSDERDKQGKSRLILDIDVAAKGGPFPADDSLYVRIEEIHRNIDQAFEATITPRTRASFS